MTIGTLIFLLLIGGSLFAMFAMHRGGASHGMGMGCGGGHGHGSSDEHRAEGHESAGDAETGEHSHGDEPARANRHRGC